MEVHAARRLREHAEHPRMTGDDGIEAGGMMIGEWTLTAAAWTDRHDHVEVNYVLDGELHVTSEGVTEVLGPGQTVVIESGRRARYEAPEYARMLFIYGPAPGGHRSHDEHYEELGGRP